MHDGFHRERIGGGGEYVDVLGKFFALLCDECSALRLRQRLDVIEVDRVYSCLGPDIAVGSASMASGCVGAPAMPR
jgi:hypothetical protein